ncbi:putative baseplate assembly protein [Cellulomonas terrae]|uniref:Putative baseplate assembly protein n=1 Tax=Cellulomonas terrae TaxID=311234 RepID=A0A511JHW9_9CELL|nr:putative baseplate assembly protein [Cellulomonas terrae]GEL97429.1 putative baseplate assembly protein [Cellulomonas terrae]
MTAGSLPFAAPIDLEARRALVRGRPGIGEPDGIDGIDHVEVLSNHDGASDQVPDAPQQSTLLVHLLNGPVPTTWTADTVHVVGGVRPDPALNPVHAVWAYRADAIVGTASDPVGPLPAGVSEADQTLVAQALPDPADPDHDDLARRVLVVRTSSWGDRSTYTLRLAGPGGLGAPDGVDLPLSTAPFAFSVDCPTDLDCREECAPSEGEVDLLPGDYLARDYEALRTRLLDRLATLLPDWTDRNPADPAVMLVELFAAVGDRLAYWQDAVAVEAYLGTARRRTSVRRHARLLGYAVHEGCSARTLLAFTTAAGALTVPERTPVTDLPARAGQDIGVPVDATDLGGTVFETVAAVEITPARNALPLYAWGDPDHCLPAGTTAAFVASGTGAADDPRLRAGDVLVLVDTPVNGVAREGDPGRRFPVRLVQDARGHDDPLNPAVRVWELRWHAADALPAPLQVTTPGTDDARALALANVVVADHGATLLDETLVPPTVPADGAFRPRLQRPDLTYTDPTFPTTGAAGALLRPDPRRAGAALSLYDGQRTWLPRPDLLASGRLATHVVVEPEPGGVSRLRFGDGLTGREPSVGSTPLASYRIGTGALGGLAPDRLVRLLPRADRLAPPAGVEVWNPLPATGGTDPERLEQVRQLAPAALRTQLRAVTSPDYATVAEQHPGVQRAVARRRWTGSWYAQEVTVDPVAALADDDTLDDELVASLEVRRMAGIDVELERPVLVPLTIALFACVRPEHDAADVEAGLRDVLGSGTRRDGQRAFFHPDRFTFGDPLRLSDVVGAAMTVDGVAWVEVTRFARADAGAAQAAATLAAGELLMSPRELLQCDSDPNDPEAGRVDIRLGGGT